MVRDTETEKWQRATIEATDPKITAKVEGAARAFGWNMMKRADAASKSV